MVPKTKLPVSVNFALLSACQMLSRFIGLAVLVRLAQALGADGLGQILLLTSLLQYVTAVIDFGFTKLGPVEVGKSDHTITELAPTISLIRLGLFGVILVLYMVSTPWLPLQSSLQPIALIYLISAFTNALDIRYVFMGTRWVIPSVVAELLRQLVYAGAILALVHNPADIIIVPLVFLGSRVIAIAVDFFFFVIRYGLPKRLLSRNQSTDLIKASVPLMASGGLGLIHFNFCLVVTGLFLDTVQCGLFGAAHRVSTSLTLLAAAYFSLLSPMLAKAFSRSQDSGKEAFSESLKLTGALGLAAVVGGIILAKPAIMMLLGPTYIAAVPALQILMFAFGISILNRNYRTLLISTGRQINDFKVSVIVAVLTVILAVVLIPLFGINGAAVVTLTAEVVMAIATCLYSREVVGGFTVPKYVWKLLASVAVMGMILFATSQQHLLVRIACGGITYLSCLFVLRLSSPKEMVGFLTGTQLERAVDEKAGSKLASTSA